jgi:hypothetical protein
MLLQAVTFPASAENPEYFQHSAPENRQATG